MVSSRASRQRHLHWMWVLCLALVLPLAQLGAFAHELSHLDPASGVPASKQKGSIASDACARCVAAAAIGSAMPATESSDCSAAAPTGPVCTPTRIESPARGWRYFPTRGPPPVS